MPPCLTVSPCPRPNSIHRVTLIFTRSPTSPPLAFRGGTRRLSASSSSAFRLASNSSAFRLASTSSAFRLASNSSAFRLAQSWSLVGCDGSPVQAGATSWHTAACRSPSSCEPPSPSLLSAPSECPHRQHDPRPLPSSLHLPVQRAPCANRFQDACKGAETALGRPRFLKMATLHAPFVASAFPSHCSEPDADRIFRRLLV